jgi:hypothetical protein
VRGFEINKNDYVPYRCRNIRTLFIAGSDRLFVSGHASEGEWILIALMYDIVIIIIIVEHAVA